MIKYLDNTSKELVPLHEALAARFMNANFLSVILSNILLNEFRTCLELCLSIGIPHFRDCCTKISGRVRFLFFHRIVTEYPFRYRLMNKTVVGIGKEISVRGEDLIQFTKKKILTMERRLNFTSKSCLVTSYLISRSVSTPNQFCFNQDM